MKRNKKFFDKFLHDLKGEKVDVVEFDMGYIPFSIERVSDGSILQLNKDNVSYSFKDSPMDGNSYSWGRMFADYRCPKAFKPLGWVKLDNLDSVHEKMRTIIENGRTIEMNNKLMYKKGEWYEQGRYIGIVDTYPFGGDYFNRNHHFMNEHPIDNTPSKINKIFIGQIKR